MTMDISLPVKNNRQNEPAFQVNISNGVEICVMGDPRHR